MLRRNFLKGIAAILGVACPVLAVKPRVTPLANQALGLPATLYGYPIAVEPTIEARVVLAGGDVLAGQSVACDNTGRVVRAAGSGNPTIGHALEAGKRGDRVLIRFT